MEKKDLLKMAQHVFKRSQNVPDKRLIHPRRDWAIGLLLFFLILVVGFIFSAQSFTQFRDLSTEDGEANVEIPRYNEALILDVLDIYRNRQIEFETLIADTTLVDEVVAIEASSTSAVGEILDEEEALSEGELIGLDDVVITATGSVEVIEE